MPCGGGKRRFESLANQQTMEAGMLTNGHLGIYYLGLYIKYLYTPSVPNYKLF
jgi:hypothetical protein